METGVAGSSVGSVGMVNTCFVSSSIELFTSALFLYSLPVYMAIARVILVY